VKIVAKGPLELAAVEAIRRAKLKRIGFESTRMVYEAYQRLKQALPLAASLKPIGSVIEKLRMIKSPDEIARIRRSVSRRIPKRLNPPYDPSGQEFPKWPSRPNSSSKCVG